MSEKQDDKKPDTEKKPTEKVEEKKPETKEPVDDTQAKKIKELEGELQERTTQLGTIALKAFQEERAKLLDLIKDETKRAGVEKYIGDDPERLQQVQMWTSVFEKALNEGGVKIEGKPKSKETGEGNETKEGKKDGETKTGDGETKDLNPEDVETVPPKGTVGLPKVDAKFVSGKAIIDEVYAILGNPLSTPVEMEKASQKANQMLSQLMAGRRKARESGKGAFQRFEFRKCPECGYLIQGLQGATDKCPACRWTLVRKKESIAR